MNGSGSGCTNETPCHAMLDRSDSSRLVHRGLCSRGLVAQPLWHTSTNQNCMRRSSRSTAFSNALTTSQAMWSNRKVSSTGQCYCCVIHLEIPQVIYVQLEAPSWDFRSCLMLQDVAGQLLCLGELRHLLVEGVALQGACRPKRGMHVATQGRSCNHR